MGEDFSVTLTREGFSRNLTPLPSSFEFRAGQKSCLPMADTELRQ